MERRDQWPLGSNNRAKPNRLPDGFVRELVNVDARPTGELVLRPGASLRHSGQNVRWVGALGQELLIVDGGDVGVLDTETDTYRVIGSIDPDGHVAGCEHNGELFFCGEAQRFRYDGTLRPWGVAVPQVQVTTEAGALPAGSYKIGVTVKDDSGDESGADVAVVQVDGTQYIRVAAPAGAAVYVSSTNGKTLYFQGHVEGSSYLVTSVVDSTQRLETNAMVPPPVGHIVASYNASLLVARGSQVWFTLPYNPGITDRTRGFVGFPAPVDNIVPGPGGVFVTADATYYVTAITSPQPQIRQVAGIPGVRGTGIVLSDGRAAWFTEYGTALGGPDGAVEFPNKMNYAPVRADKGAAGLVEHDGGSTIVTTLGAGVRLNAAATADFCDLEVVKK